MKIDANDECGTDKEDDDKSCASDEDAKSGKKASGGKGRPVEGAC